MVGVAPGPEQERNVPGSIEVREHESGKVATQEQSERISLRRSRQSHGTSRSGGRDDLDWNSNARKPNIEELKPPRSAMWETKSRLQAETAKRLFPAAGTSESEQWQTRSEGP